MIKVYDGNASIKKKTFRTITIPRSATKDQVIAAALRTFHIHDDPRYYVISDFDGKQKITLNLIDANGPFFCNQILRTVNWVTLCLSQV